MKKCKIGVDGSRCRLRSITDKVNRFGPMVYLMRRDIRVCDNWSLLRSQEECRPVRVAHIIESSHPTYRLAWFYFQGLKEIKEDLTKLNIPLDLIEESDQFQDYLKVVDASGIVVDLNTLREFDLKPVVTVCNELSIPVWEVDSHNIVPVWEASDKQEYAARTIRPKINNKLKDYLVDIPPPSSNAKMLKPFPDGVKNVMEILSSRWNKIDPPSIEQLPGERAGKVKMMDFLKRIVVFEKDRNDPTKDGTSGLSPWFRHGHLSKQRVAYEVIQTKMPSASFLEELIIRGELAENYTYYNSNYDNLEGAPSFGKKTLADHEADKREFVYSFEELKDSKTHDPLWNAAQIQLTMDGKMHGFMRMYWAKKILEWTNSPKEALEFAIRLNDTYSLDGRDPRGYVGIMWSIAGLHDQGWKERPVFGKVRYMNFNGCKRKFDVDLYIRQNKMK